MEGSEGSLIHLWVAGKRKIPQRLSIQMTLGHVWVKLGLLLNDDYQARFSY